MKKVTDKNLKKFTIRWSIFMIIFVLALGCYKQSKTIDCYRQYYKESDKVLTYLHNNYLWPDNKDFQGYYKSIEELYAIDELEE